MYYDYYIADVDATADYSVIIILRCLTVILLLQQLPQLSFDISVNLKTIVTA